MSAWMARPALVLATVLAGACSDADEFESSAQRDRFCGRYDALFAALSNDEAIAEQKQRARDLREATPESLRDDVELSYLNLLDLGPRDESGMTAEQAAGNVSKFVREHCPD